VAVHTFWSSGVPCARKNCSPLWIQVMGILVAVVLQETELVDGWRRSLVAAGV